MLGAMSSPISTRPHLASQLTLIAVSAALLLLYLFHSGFHGDEFTNLNDALRQLHGQVIYRDFFEFAAPLSSWIAAATFALTGPSVLTARLVQSGALLFGAWQLYALARRMDTPPWLATLPGLILLGSLYRAWPGYSHHWILLPLVLGALQAALGGLDGRAWLWSVAGALAGVATLDMQTDGPVLLFAIAGAWGLDALMRRDALRQRLIGFGLLGLGFALPLAGAALYFYSQGALTQAFDSVWLWPLHHYKQPGGFNDVPYGSDWLAEIEPIATKPLWFGRAFHLTGTYLLAPAAAIAGLVWLGVQLLRRRWASTQAHITLVLLLTLGDLTLVTHGRADYPRIAIYAVPAVLLLSTLAGRFWLTLRPRALALLPSLLLVAYAGTGLFLLGRYVAAAPASWLTFQSPDKRIAAIPVLTYLREHTRPGDRLVVFPDGGVFYFYARPDATRYTLIYPAKYRYMSPRELAEVWSEIEHHAPKFLVIGPYEFTGKNLADFFPDGVPTGYHRVPQTFTFDAQPIWLYQRTATKR